MSSFKIINNSLSNSTVLKTSTGDKNLLSAIDEKVKYLGTTSELLQLDTSKLDDNQVVNVQGSEYKWDDGNSKWVPISPINMRAYDNLYDTDHTAQIQALIDNPSTSDPGTNGIRVIPPGVYNVPGDITIKGVAHIGGVQGGMKIIATGAVFTGGGNIILDSCKRVTIVDLDAPTHTLVWRGLWQSQFTGMRFRKLLVQDQQGEVFSSSYWNVFMDCQLQQVFISENATRSVNAISWVSCDFRARSDQGFTEDMDYILVLNSNQNQQNWSFYACDMSYPSVGNISIGNTNTSGDIEITFDCCYFDSSEAYPQPISDRENIKIVVRNSHIAGQFLSGATMKGASRGGHEAWQKRRTNGWKPYITGNLIPNGDFAQEMEDFTGTNRPLTTGGGANLTYQTGSGLTGGYLNVNQTGSGAAYFRGTAPFTGKYTATMILRNADAGTKTMRFGFAGIFSSLEVSDSEWSVYTIGKNELINEGETPTIAFFSGDQFNTFNVDVCYAGIVFGDTPQIASPQLSNTAFHTDVYSTQFRPGIVSDNPPVWTSGTGSPEGVVSGSVGSLYTDQNGGANTTLYVKESGFSDTGWTVK